MFVHYNTSFVIDIPIVMLLWLYKWLLNQKDFTIKHCDKNIFMAASNKYKELIYIVS